MFHYWCPATTTLIRKENDCSTAMGGLSGGGHPSRSDYSKNFHK